VKVKMVHAYHGIPFSIEIICDHPEVFSILSFLVDALTRFIDGLEDVGGTSPASPETRKRVGGLVNEF